MNYRLIQMLNGRMVVGAEGNIENVVPALQVRGFRQVGAVPAREYLRRELIGQPVFAGVIGPMWDGDAVRYEAPAANQALSV